jgi:hypothetical protein
MRLSPLQRGAFLKFLGHQKVQNEKYTRIQLRAAQLQQQIAGEKWPFVVMPAGFTDY